MSQSLSLSLSLKKSTKPFKSQVSLSLFPSHELALVSSNTPAKIQSTYFCELFCMALCNFAPSIFCLCLEISCIFQFSHSRLAFWKASYHNLQNADRDTVKMSTITVRLCPQSCPQTSHDESRQTSVEALMWR